MARESLPSERREVIRVRLGGRSATACRSLGGSNVIKSNHIFATEN